MADLAPVIFRPAVPSDDAAIAAFYRRVQPSGERTLELMAWRDRDAAVSGGNHLMLAFDGDALCGTVNAVSLQLVRRGVRLPAVWQQDSLVDPDMRGRGIGRRLVAENRDGRSVVVAKGTSDAMYALRKAAGFKDCENANYLACALRPFTSHGSPSRRIASFVLWAYGAARSGRAPSGIEVHEVRHFEGADALAAQIATGDEVVVLKSAAYLSWRYLETPGRRYTILRADAGDGLRGYAVIRTPLEPGGDAWLVDLIAPTEDTSVLLALVASAKSRARAEGAGALKTFATSTRVRTALSREGFVDLKASPRFTFQAPPGSDNIDEAPWSFFHGDGDAELYG